LGSSRGSDALVIDENVLNEKAYDLVAPGGVKGVRSFLEPGEERRHRFCKSQIDGFLALLAGERRKLSLRRPLPLAQFGHSAPQFVQRQKVLLISSKQALNPFAYTDKFALQSFRAPLCRAALPRCFQTPVDLRLDQRRTFQQFNDRIPDNGVKQVHADGMGIAKGVIEMAVSVRAQAAVVVDFAGR